MSSAAAHCNVQDTSDVVVVGGGLVGSALAFGLADAGLQVRLLDEGDAAFRAARGNFGLVWIQAKGQNAPHYARLSRASADLWPALASRLERDTGRSVGYQQAGGLYLCLSETELQERLARLARMQGDHGTGQDCEHWSPQDLHSRLPGVGPDVVGATYCPHEGQANPLKLLRALQESFVARGGTYCAGAPVSRIAWQDRTFVVESGHRRWRAGRVVVSAGLGTRDLAAQVGVTAAVRPVRGQIIVTERLPAFLPIPTFLVRQAEEGGVFMGDSQEEVGHDDGTRAAVLQEIARRATRYFPRLVHARVVRTWGALRVMPPSGLPIYQESPTFPGAYVVTCHSGVTLAAFHALRLAAQIAHGRLQRDLEPFAVHRPHPSHEATPA